MLWLRAALVSSTFAAIFFVLLPRWVLATAGQPVMATGLPRVGAMVLLAGGIAMMLWCVGAFGVHGRGTPAPFDPPRQLVVRGPYRYMRNPMYLGGILLLFGQAALFASVSLVAYAVALWLAAHLLVLGYEEPILARTFGRDYAAYRATVSRWVPRGVRASTDAAAMAPFALIIKHKTRPGRREEVSEIWRRHMAPAIMTNPGHTAYHYCLDNTDPDSIYAFQQYASIEASQAFLRTTSYAAYLNEVEPLLDGPPHVTALTPMWSKGR